MTFKFVIETIILAVAIVLCAVCVWYNDKLVAFEKKVYEVACDRIGYIAAKIYVAYRRHRREKSLCRIEKALDILDKENSYLEKVEGKKQ